MESNNDSWFLVPCSVFSVRFAYCKLPSVLSSQFSVLSSQVSVPDSFAFCNSKLAVVSVRIKI